MSDTPQPIREPPAHLEEEPLPQPPYPDDAWDGEDDDDDAPAALYPPGPGWPHPDRFWPT